MQMAIYRSMWRVRAVMMLMFDAVEPI